MPSSCPAVEPDLAGGNNAWTQALGDCRSPEEDGPVHISPATETDTTVERKRRRNVVLAYMHKFQTRLSHMTVQSLARTIIIIEQSMGRQSSGTIMKHCKKQSSAVGPL